MRFFTAVFVTTILCCGSRPGLAQERFLLFESSKAAEFGFTMERPAKISESEAVQHAIRDLHTHLDNVGNISSFDTFSKTRTSSTIRNKYEQLGPLMRNTTTFSSEKEREGAFRGNRRGFIITVRASSFKAGTFGNSSDYNKLTGVRKSRAWGTLLYTFRVYAPEGFQQSSKSGYSASENSSQVKYTILNGTGRTVRFSMQPSGKSYTLASGKTFSSTSSVKGGKQPTITLTDSGRTIKLVSGDHKFWWNDDESRVAFDLNYDK
jgi:hypothetical protein